MVNCACSVRTTQLILLKLKYQQSHILFFRMYKFVFYLVPVVLSSNINSPLEFRMNKYLKGCLQIWEKDFGGQVCKVKVIGTLPLSHSPSIHTLSRTSHGSAGDSSAGWTNDRVDPGEAVFHSH